MGAGTAGQAQGKFSRFPVVAGLAVSLHGNHVFPFSPEELREPSIFGEGYKETAKWLITFPVKHHWYEIADIELIERSAHELMHVIDRLDLEKVLLPRPGCGKGLLSWDIVRPVLSPILDDRVWVINKE